MSNLQTPYNITGVAGADLSAQVNRFVAYDANGRMILASSPTANISLGPLGVLTFPASSLRPVAVAIRGPQDVIVAATLAPGVLVATNSVGGARPAASGDVVNGQYLGMANALPTALAQIELCASPWRLTRTE